MLHVIRAEKGAVLTPRTSGTVLCPRGDVRQSSGGVQFVDASLHGHMPLLIPSDDANGLLHHLKHQPAKDRILHHGKVIMSPPAQAHIQVALVATDWTVPSTKPLRWSAGTLARSEQCGKRLCSQFHSVKPPMTLSAHGLNQT